MVDTKTAGAAGQRDWCVCCCHPVLIEVAAIPFICQSLWEIATSEERTGTWFEGNISNITSLSGFSGMAYKQMSNTNSFSAFPITRPHGWSFSLSLFQHLVPWTTLSLASEIPHSPVSVCNIHLSLQALFPHLSFSMSLFPWCLSVALSASLISSTSKVWNTISFLSLNIAFLISFPDSRCIYYRSSCWPHGWKPTDAN